MSFCRLLAGLFLTGFVLSAAFRAERQSRFRFQNET